MEKVPMIAGSYEWECLECDELNTEPSVPVIGTSIGKLKCTKCKTEFECGEVDHCYDDRR